MKRILLLASITALSILPAAADGKIDTRRQNLTATAALEALERLNQNPQEAFSDSIAIYGYDKKITDKNEYFYVANHTPFRLSKLVVRFSYTNTDGVLLHEETYDIPCDIPSGATRMLSVESWDRRHAHYYYKSRKPRRSAIPYSVSYTLLRYDVAITIEE